MPQCTATNRLVVVIATGAADPHCVQCTHVRCIRRRRSHGWPAGKATASTHCVQVTTKRSPAVIAVHGRTKKDETVVLCTV